MVMVTGDAVLLDFSSDGSGGGNAFAPYERGYYTLRDIDSAGPDLPSEYILGGNTRPLGVGSSKTRRRAARSLSLSDDGSVGRASRASGKILLFYSPPRPNPNPYVFLCFFFCCYSIPTPLTETTFLISPSLRYRHLTHIFWATCLKIRSFGTGDGQWQKITQIDSNGCPPSSHTQYSLPFIG